MRIFFPYNYKGTLMYEFKNHVIGVKKGEARLKRLEALAIIHFSECPKFLTLATHTNLLDVTPIHCYRERDRKVIDFTVPKQSFIFLINKTGLRFSVLKVFNENGKLHWLVVCEGNRRGFLLPGYVLNRFANPVKLKRGSPGRIVH